MNSASHVADHIVERGQQLYEERLRALLEPGHTGEFVVIDVDTGDYEMDANHLAAYRRLAASHPGKVFYALRVGFPTLITLGGRRIQQP